VGADQDDGKKVGRCGFAEGKGRWIVLFSLVDMRLAAPLLLFNHTSVCGLIDPFSESEGILLN
jgi:hypothetical protein